MKFRVNFIDCCFLYHKCLLLLAFIHQFMLFLQIGKINFIRQEVVLNLLSNSISKIFTSKIIVQLSQRASRYNTLRRTAMACSALFSNLY